MPARSRTDQTAAFSGDSDGGGDGGEGSLGNAHARIFSHGSLQANKEEARLVAVAEAATWVAAVTATNPPPQGECADEAEVNLQGWLKSGELLCELINRVQPGAVRRIAASSLPFKQMENIAHYIAACRQLGVLAQDLFQTVDLFEGKDVRAVVRNVHSLGRVAQTVASFEGPHLGPKLAVRNERHFSEAQLAEARAMPARWTNVGKLMPQKR
jgi:hypothetical protein